MTENRRTMAARTRPPESRSNLGTPSINGNLKYNAKFNH